VKTVHLMLDHHTAKLLYYDNQTEALRPQLVFVDAGGSIAFEINELGLKGDAVDDGRQLAVVWGDSVVFGAGWGWPCLLDGLAPGYQFLNGGIEGDSFTNILRRASELNQQRAVALNLVMLGWHPLPDNSNVRSTLAAFLQRTPNTVLLTMPTALNKRIARQDLSRYFTDRDTAHAFAFCGNLAYSRELQSVAFDYIIERNQIIRDVSSQMDVPLVDLFAAFETECRDDFRQDFIDMLHLRPIAYPKIARVVYGGIRHLLQPAATAGNDSGIGPTCRSNGSAVLSNCVSTRQKAMQT
jgi:lysophospholipase L1-like esterase